MQEFPIILTPILVFLLGLTGFYGIFVLALTRRGTTIGGVATWYLQSGLLVAVTLVLSGLAEVVAAIVGYIDQQAVYGSSTISAVAPNGFPSAGSGPDMRGPDLVLGLLCMLIGAGLWFVHTYLSGTTSATSPLAAPRWTSWAAPLTAMVYFAVLGVGSLIGFVTALTNNWANCSNAGSSPCGAAVGSELILALIFIPAWIWLMRQFFVGGGLGPAAGAAGPVYAPPSPPAPAPMAPVSTTPAPQPPQPPTYPTV